MLSGVGLQMLLKVSQPADVKQLSTHCDLVGKVSGGLFKKAISYCSFSCILQLLMRGLLEEKSAI